MTYLRILAISVFTGLMSIIALVGSLDRSFTIYFFLARVFAKGVLWMAGVKLVVKGLGNFSPADSYVYVSNHSSMFDIPAIMGAVPNRASIVFKKELARVPVFGWQLLAGPYILIDRQNPEKAMHSIELAKRALREKNYSVILFAEGTRSKTGDVQPFKRGAFYLASRVHHPVIPVSISGSEKIMAKGEMKLVRGSITVTFDKPIEVFASLNKKEELELMEKVRNIVIQNKAQA